MIVRYLLGTRDKGLLFKPTNDLSHFECYVDTDFAGNYKLVEIPILSNLGQDVSSNIEGVRSHGFPDSKQKLR